MKKILHNIGNKIGQWMQGRYGSDELTIALSLIGLSLFTFSHLLSLQFPDLLGFAMIIWSCFRFRKFTRRWADWSSLAPVSARLPGDPAILQRMKIWAAGKATHKQILK